MMMVQKFLRHRRGGAIPPLHSSRLVGLLQPFQQQSTIQRKRSLQSSFLLFSSSSSYERQVVTETTLPPIPPNAHRMVLMRHGESEFNNANIFTGWCDVALTPRGVVEAVEAGQVFASHNIIFEHCYTSMLTRSIVTAHRSLEAAGIAYTPIQYDWRFNERHYGALQGLSKERTAERLGRTKVMKWRRSFKAQPPLMTAEHPHYEMIQNDPRYKQQRQQQQQGTSSSSTTLPLGESLEQCQHRVIEAWNDILLDISSKNNNNDDDDDDGEDNENNNNNDSNNKNNRGYSLMVAHANTLRALVMHLDEMDASSIEGINIPTAIPFYYDIDTITGTVISTTNNTSQATTIPGGHFRGIYIADERKKRNFFERRYAAANDPWLWALYDHQVEESMLLGGRREGGEGDDDSSQQQQQQQQRSEDVNNSNGVDTEVEEIAGNGEGLVGLEEEAKHNTELFSSTTLHHKDN